MYKMILYVCFRYRVPSDFHDFVNKTYEICIILVLIIINDIQMHSNLLKQIEQVQSGLTSGTRFQHRVKSQLIQNIQLNTLENLEKVHTGASINSVDLEAIENR